MQEAAHSSSRRRSSTAAAGRRRGIMGRQQQPPQRWRLVVACLVLAAAVMVLHVQGWRVPSLHHQQPARSAQRHALPWTRAGPGTRRHPLRMVQQDAEPGDGGNEPGRVEGDGPVSLPPIPMSSLAAPDLGEGGDGGLASLTAAWEGSGGAPLGGYSEDDEEGRMVAAKLRRMLERKIDLWDPEEVFELMPTLMKGDRFEWALEQRLADPATTPKEKKRLEHSRGFLASLKYAEQQRLAREWIEGVLEAATESAEAMDEQIYELAEYESGVLVQPVLEALDQMLRRLKEMSPDEKTLTQVVMETLRKRVEAEVKTREQPFVRLLAVLLRLETAADRERVLRTELRNSRLVAEFAAWLEEGIDYVARLQLGPQRLPDNTAEEMAKVLALLRGFMGDDPAAGDARPPAGEGAGGGVIDVGEGGPPSQG